MPDVNGRGKISCTTRNGRSSISRSARSSDGRIASVSAATRARLVRHLVRQDRTTRAPQLYRRRVSTRAMMNLLLSDELPERINVRAIAAAAPDTP